MYLFVCDISSRQSNGVIPSHCNQLQRSVPILFLTRVYGLKSHHETRLLYVHPQKSLHSWEKESATLKHCSNRHFAEVSGIDVIFLRFQCVLDMETSVCHWHILTAGRQKTQCCSSFASFSLEILYPPLQLISTNRFSETTLHSVCLLWRGTNRSAQPAAEENSTSLFFSTIECQSISWGCIV